ncbi:MAG: hypothetical protein MUC84_02235, partial [Solirubrobacteraceae bacterium]|nr:hypothetical protein [Solirubrobacteraceae bacterium]
MAISAVVIAPDTIIEATGCEQRDRIFASDYRTLSVARRRLETLTLAALAASAVAPIRNVPGFRPAVTLIDRVEDAPAASDDRVAHALAFLPDSRNAFGAFRHTLTFVAAIVPVFVVLIRSVTLPDRLSFDVEARTEIVSFAAPAGAGVSG